MALAGVLAATACGPGYEGLEIDFRASPVADAGSPTAAEPTDTLIRMAVAPVISPRETFHSRYRDLLVRTGLGLTPPHPSVE